jgi:cytochrome c-type biogenesis protein CcmH/NrfF
MNNDELKQLQKELGLSDQEVQQISADLQQGDYLLNSFSVEPLADDLVNSINNQINSKLQPRLHRPNRMLWLRRIAAVIVVAFVALSVLYLRDHQQIQPQPIPTIEQEPENADRQLWEFALMLDDTRAFESTEAMDSETMTDLLLLFDDAELSAETPLGKEVAWPTASGMV